MQENPDDFDSGPLYLLTQAVKENSQVSVAAYSAAPQPCSLIVVPRTQSP